MSWARWASLADQVMSNASNWLFTVLVAGIAAPAAFGRFAVGYSVFTFAVSVLRTGLSYQVSMKAGDRDALHEESRRAVGATLAVALPLAVVVLAVVGLGSGTDPALAWGLAVATPFVLTQDLLRYAAVAADRTNAALLSDSLWTALLLVAVALRTQGLLSVSGLVLLWVTGSILAAAILVWALRIAPLLKGAGDWIRRSWRGRVHVVGGGLINGASVPLTAGIVAFVAGPVVAAGVAGAGLLMAPVNSLVAWMSLTLLARASAEDGSRRRAVFLKVGLGAAALAAGWGLMLFFVPESIGHALLGQAWPMSIQAIPVIWIQHALAVLAATGNFYLISIARTRAVLGNGVVVAVARTALGSLAAFLIGSVFAAATAETLAMAVWLGAVIWYLRPRDGADAKVRAATVS